MEYTSQPVGKEQPSESREIRPASPETELEARQKTIERDLGPVLPSRREQPTPELQKMEHDVSVRFRSVGEAMVHGLQQKWNEFGARMESVLEPGETLSFSVSGHAVVAERNEESVVFSVDGQPQNSAPAMEFLERNWIELGRDVREEEKVAEEEKRREEFMRSHRDDGRSGPDAMAEFQRREEERRRREREMAARKFERDDGRN